MQNYKRPSQSLRNARKDPFECGSLKLKVHQLRSNSTPGRASSLDRLHAQDEAGKST